jgi:hypothetical protein
LLGALLKITSYPGDEFSYTYRIFEVIMLQRVSSGADLEIPASIWKTDRADCEPPNPGSEAHGTYDSAGAYSIESHVLSARVVSTILKYL